MFGRKKKGKKAEYKVESENLAVPEIHTGEVDHSDDTDKEKHEESITYENVAIPEIHIVKKQ
nr:hypothetical protein [uncultured Blautia sp.]